MSGGGDEWGGADVDEAMDIGAVYAAALRYARMLLRSCPDRDAEDAVQGAWVKAGASLAALPGDADRARFLKRAVLQVVIDDARRRKRRPTVSLVDWYPNPARFEEAVIDGLMLAPYLLAAATDPYLLAVVLLALGYDQREAGARMGCAAGTVSTRVWRYRRAHGGLQT